MADTAKHTPGPWDFIDATKVARMQFAPKCVIKAGDRQIADFSWHESSPWFPTKAESQANARLIAAAPELLAVAKRILERGYVSENIEEERADHLALATAIAKAEARP